MPKTDTILSAKALRYFLQLTETMNYTQAAQILGITQPALTQQIKKLEHAIGAPLFGQVGKKLYLTEAGKKMEAASSSLLDTISSVINDIQEFTQIDRGTITIGILKTIDLPIFNKFLATFKNKYPNVVLRVETYERERLWQLLDTNALDVAIMYLPDNTRRDHINLHHQYNHLNVVDDEIVILSHDPDLEANVSYPVGEFVNSKWIAYPDTFYLTQIIRDSFGPKHSMDIVGSFTDSRDLVNFATETNYNTFVTRTFFEQHRDSISLTPVFLKRNRKFNISIVYSKSKVEVPRIKNLIDEWKKYIN
ncbi:transcriptional regulator [Lactobacillus pasteurii DSM 23907 = CRBIP 24.76]|uniref:Putative transcriptional regulator n=1 Tax=Lactobacillus pasteurii DSM 23907 = CRBIP 24.76 TaxID=1423790 RepID=I7KLS2_9LACO|nr:LysR family transcriptional regulator [Lactobacillus pasteurii]KRK08582.1 transcriptional regulator [Lactobacillus pasteurii DSM 23907 = CRBIP 24.76]TDG75763.1 hypothetical protein C5L33_000648 [Lactobacillus pasteurii]CCI85554.1 Putative transcriptional regulator [Lactobacillus pasteurii DSM 23907 = CRBIP 24.76]